MDARNKISKLARLYGIQASYYDVKRRRQTATAETLLALLQALGAPVTGLADVPAALREKEQSLWCTMLEPVAVAWDGVVPAITVHIPASRADETIRGVIIWETGEERNFRLSPHDIPIIKWANVEGVNYLAGSLALPGIFPPGYHRLILDSGGVINEAMVISAPSRAYADPAHRWGVFIPLYALYRRQSWGSGDLGDMQALMECISGLGASVVATLPFLAAFLDKPMEPAPYSPASRVFWNEFYLDVPAILEMAQCPEAQAVVNAPDFQEELKALRAMPLVDYPRQMAAKRKALASLAQCFFREQAPRRPEFDRFRAAKPEVEEYARFRAVMEKREASWPDWPDSLRPGALTPSDYDETARRYHLFVQWQAQRQVDSLVTNARTKGQRLYLDLPLGVHPQSYDAWRWRDEFAIGASTGAPPDALFTRGQDWRFPPLHPESLRRHGYDYFIATLQHHFKHCGILRLDHVMGLHRLYWIPRGLEASQGGYVRYHTDELYAILTLESQRSSTVIVGEDLGTVPPEVRPKMRRHGLQRMYIVHYELYSGTPERVPAASAASLGTHDMPPFASFWEERDIDELRRIGLFDSAETVKAREERRTARSDLAALLRKEGWLNPGEADAPSALKACLDYIAAGPARIVLVNLEDLWGETGSHNIPSTTGELFPNWRRKARYDMETFCQMTPVTDTLKQINALRQRGEGQNG